MHAKEENYNQMENRTKQSGQICRSCLETPLLHKNSSTKAKWKNKMKRTTVQGRRQGAGRSSGCWSRQSCAFCACVMTSSVTSRSRAPWREMTSSHPAFLTSQRSPGSPGTNWTISSWKNNWSTRRQDIHIKTRSVLKIQKGKTDDLNTNWWWWTN